MRHFGAPLFFLLLLLVVLISMSGGVPDAQAAANASFLITPTGLEFGDVSVGSTSPVQQAQVTNVSTASVVISMAGGAPSGPFGAFQNCQAKTLNPGQSCQISYTFEPTAPGAASGTSNGTVNGQAFSIALHGSGIESLLITPTGLEFGDVSVGSTSPVQQTQVTNVSTAPVVISMAGGAPSGPFGAFQNCQAKTLNPGQSCQISYTFEPTAPGAASGTSNGTVNGQAFSIALHGTGTTGPSSNNFLITPISFEYGNVPVGSTSPTQDVQVTNVSSASVVVSMAGGAPSGPFGGFQNCQGKTLNPGQSCQISYSFQPTAPGPANGSTSGSVNGQAFSFTFHGTGVEGFLITPTALEFGEILVGSTSPIQDVQVTNVGSASVVVSMAGGAGGVFGGFQNCQGKTLNPGQSCQISYSFQPTAPGPANGSTSGSINGQAFSFTFHGTGVSGVQTSLVPGSPVAIGTVVHDTATLAGVTANAGGTVTYSVYTDSACTVPYAGHQPLGNPVTVTSGRVPNSGNVTFDQAGTFYWQAVYSGDASNPRAQSACTSETVVVNKNTSGLATALVPASPAPAGTAVHDTATLTGATAGAGGTVTYSVFTDSACTALYAGHQPTGNPVTVTNGVVPNSGNVTFDQVGTFYWQAVYSGDANNSVATSACTSEAITINAVLPSVTTISSASSVTQTSATLSGNVTDAGGGTISARGIVLAPASVNPLPALSGSGVTQLTDASNGLGTFSEEATGLLPGTNYVARAFATNQAGTSYGAVVSFTTLITGPVATPPVKGGPLPTQGPSLTKAFGTLTLNVGGSTTLSFTVSNPNSTPLTGISFTDALPAGISITGAVSGSCPSGLINTTPSSVVLNGATLTPGQSCSFSITVTALTAGTWTNSAAAIANGTGFGPTASATLTVGTPPTPFVKKGL